jgi:hypothetical protein
MSTAPAPSDPALNTSQTSVSPAETLTPLEQEVLDEYARLLGNLNNVCDNQPFYYIMISALNLSPSFVFLSQSPNF